MITTMPLGSWSWETKTLRSDDNAAIRCVREVLAVWAGLRAGGLAEGDAQADITVYGKTEGEFLLDLKRVRVAAAGTDDELSQSLRSVDLAQARLVTIDLATPGVCLRAGEARHVQKMFVISVDAWASGAGTVTLYTFSDAWMSHDLRGHRQTGIQQENAPRLAAALAEISRITGAEVVPSDPTLYATPTTTGFEDLPDEDPDLLDSWYMFEVPRRTDRLLNQLPPGSPCFETQAESPVAFAEVTLGDRVIGYLWASDRDDAAGYEPRTPAGDIALDAAKEWLARLSEAKRRRLSPSAALHELAAWQGDSRSGTVVAGSLRTAPSLEDLQDLSGRE
ncbi:hypothetical protein SSP24_74340 [Streptomyces spinoverrucosus]|uniref:Uncharacterized protein n=1 Tax=Streptomyces spinoverrucosus TaxID=284043 RepID=A0A4Y3VVT0_9ACTN|nr:hypothetical protein [Streptomyces spinoverrucosus]GEC09779.1 hypothetical protein SSP24_74340 [Streptomyces spinoverrucosus]GHB52308.1 hypothetical protein GCM10010397_22730 [Streptomyces spinoverrucosus]